MPAWFITECSTGLGRALARAVLMRGWHAVVTARDHASVRDIVAIDPACALPVRLDGWRWLVAEPGEDPQRFRGAQVTDTA